MHLRSNGAKRARRTLAERFDPRANSLSVLRLSLALTVAVVHAQALARHTQPKLGNSYLGDLAVDGFFVVSGFLVTRSVLRLPTLRRYVWHRALRIMPGFWVCLAMVAFVVAPLLAVLQDRSPAVVLTEAQSAPGYVLRNAVLFVGQWDVAGLAAARNEGAIDGSLWTLWYEALCYVGLAVLVKAVADRWRGPALLGWVAASWGWLAAQSAGLAGGPNFLPRFFLLFGLGALGWRYAHLVRFGAVTVAAAVAVLAVSLLVLSDYRAVGGVALAYLLLWAVVALPVRVEPPADLSYGLYVYHWPVELLLVTSGATVLGLAGYMVLAIVLTGAVALASWHWVEAPALARKNAAWVDTVFSRRAVRV